MVYYSFLNIFKFVLWFTNNLHYSKCAKFYILLQVLIKAYLLIKIKLNSSSFKYLNNTI